MSMPQPVPVPVHMPRYMLTRTVRLYEIAYETNGDAASKCIDRDDEHGKILTAK